MATVEEMRRQMEQNSNAWQSADAQTREQLHQQNVQLQKQIDQATGSQSTYHAASGTWNSTPASGGSKAQGGAGNGGFSGGANYITETGQNKQGYYAPAASTPDVGDRLQAAISQGKGYQEVQQLLNERLQKIGGDQSLEKYRYDAINQAAQSYIQNQQAAEQRAQMEETYAQIAAQQKAAAQAAVRQAVNGLNGQKETVNQSYADLFRQLYIDRRMAEKNLPQQMAAMGYTGGLAESSALALQTNYNQQLQAGEQERLSSLSELDRAIADAQLSGDISAAEQAAQLAQNRLNSYAALLEQQQAQDNWLQQMQYQQRQDASALSRQQALDELSAQDTSYERRLALAQYLYETTGDASGFRGLGYTDSQIASLTGAVQRAQSSGRRYSDGGGGNTPKGLSEKDIAALRSAYGNVIEEATWDQILAGNPGLTEDMLRAAGFEKLGHDTVNQSTDSWVVVPGYGRVTWQELEALERQGVVKETFDEKTGKYVYRRA